MGQGSAADIAHIKLSYSILPPIVGWLLFPSSFFFPLYRFTTPFAYKNARASSASTPSIIALCPLLPTNPLSNSTSSSSSFLDLLVLPYILSRVPPSIPSYDPISDFLIHVDLKTSAWCLKGFGFLLSLLRACRHLLQQLMSRPDASMSIRMLI